MKKKFNRKPDQETINNFCEAACSGDRVAVQEYLSLYEAKHLDAPSLRSGSFSFGYPALAQAIMNKKRDIAGLLLEKGFDIDQTTGGLTARTALMLAVDHDTDSLQFLIDKGADVNKQSPQAGATAVLIAVGVCNLAAVKVLCKSGADVSLKTDEGMSPLLLACSVAPVEIIEALLDHGADIHETGVDGCTPLMKAMKFGRGQTADLLRQWPEILEQRARRKEAEEEAEIKKAIEGGAPAGLVYHGPLKFLKVHP